MDISTAITPTTSTQHFIIWTLLGFLLSWMIIFALLALRPDAKSRVELDDAVTASPIQPVPTASTPLQLPMQLLAPSPGPSTQAVVESIGHESSIVLEKSQ